MNKALSRAAVLFVETIIFSIVLVALFVVPYYLARWFEPYIAPPITFFGTFCLILLHVTDTQSDMPRFYRWVWGGIIQGVRKIRHLVPVFCTH